MSRNGIADVIAFVLRRLEVLQPDSQAALELRRVLENLEKISEKSEKAS